MTATNELAATDLPPSSPAPSTELGGSERAADTRTTRQRAADERAATERAATYGARPHKHRTLTVVVLGKGGAGKSTTTACLGDALQRLTGWSTVLVDLDPQASLTAWLAPTAAPTLVEVLAHEGPSVRDVAVDLRDGLRLLPAHDGLADLAGAQLNAEVLRADLVGLTDDGRGPAVAFVDTPAAQPVTTSTVLLHAAFEVADLVVVPFALGRMAVRAMVDVAADLAVMRPDLPVLFLPANVERPDDVDAGVGLAHALRPELVFAGAVKRDKGALTRAEDGSTLLADVTPRSATVRHYAAAAAQVADMLRTERTFGGVL